MDPEPMRRMVTGISSLDPVIEGGMPKGSLVLLMSDVGGGGREFAYSSLIYLSLMMVKAEGTDPTLPSSLVYMTSTRSRDDVLDEIRLSFSRDITSNLDIVQFEDLSPLYFEMSIAPVDWYSDGDILSRIRSRYSRDSPLAYVADQLNTYEKGSLVILDSLTSLATYLDGTNRWNELIAFLRALQRIAKEWHTCFYLILTSGILDSRHEIELEDAMDAVLHFRWEDMAGARRQRVMYFQKFRGMMTHLEERDLVKFAIRISSGGAFEVANIRVVI